MRILALVLLCLACFVLGACATAGKSSNVATEIPKTIDQACTFFTTTKPKVVALRDWSVKNWDAKVPGTDQPVIPTEAKTLLTELDGHLKELDALGVDVCALNAVLKAAAGNGSNAGSIKAAIKTALGNVTIDEVLTGVLKVMTTVAQLKAQGVF